VRILGVEEIKTAPCISLSQPFVERLIRTTRWGFLDRTSFWNAHDLERKLGELKEYYNEDRAHAALGSGIPVEIAGEAVARRADARRFRWRGHRRGLYKRPLAT
jgi:hypothetical protein